MPYDYAKERPKLFTEDGSPNFIKAREAALTLLSAAGAFTAGKFISRTCISDTWFMLACLDRLVETKEIKCALMVGATQDWIYIKAYMSVKDEWAAIARGACRPRHLQNGDRVVIYTKENYNLIKKTGVVTGIEEHYIWVNLDGGHEAQFYRQQCRKLRRKQCR